MGAVSGDEAGPAEATLIKLALHRRELPILRLIRGRRIMVRRRALIELWQSSRCSSLPRVISLVAIRRRRVPVPRAAVTSWSSFPPFRPSHPGPSKPASAPDSPRTPRLSSSVSRYGESKYRLILDGRCCVSAHSGQRGKVFQLENVTGSAGTTDYGKRRKIR